MILLVVFCIVSVLICFCLVSRTLTDSYWPLPARGRHDRLGPDYEKINRMEIELGIPPSNYSAQGVDGVGLLVADADRRLREAERASEEIEDQLNPMRVTRRTIASVMAVPSHQMGKTKLLEGCPACGGGQTVGSEGRCAACGWMPGRPSGLIQQTDELYPIEIITPWWPRHLPRLTDAEKQARLEAIMADPHGLSHGSEPIIP